MATISKLELFHDGKKTLEVLTFPLKTLITPYCHIAVVMASQLSLDKNTVAANRRTKLLCSN